MLGHHILLIYETSEKLNRPVARFINDGLQSNEVCIIYDDISRKKQQIEDLLILIKEHTKYLESKQLILVDFSNGGSSTNDYLNNLEVFKKQILKILEEKKTKIRCVGTLAGHLFHNEEFEECSSIENWCDDNQNRITTLCPYFYSPVIKSEFNMQFHNVARKHSRCIDTENNIISEFTYR